MYSQRGMSALLRQMIRSEVVVSQTSERAFQFWERMMQIGLEQVPWTLGTFCPPVETFRFIEEKALLTERPAHTSIVVMQMSRGMFLCAKWVGRFGRSERSEPYSAAISLASSRMLARGSIHRAGSRELRGGRGMV